MKKIVLFSLLLLSVLQLHASLRQTKYRWRNDDGNETAATWMAAENTPVSVFSTVPAIRLRMELDNDNGLAFTSPVSETLEYSSDGGTTWTPITGAPTDEFEYTTSTFVTNGASTTNQMGASTPGTYSAGRIVTAPSASPLDLDDAARTEYEWVIKPRGNIGAVTTYIFRSENQETDPLEWPEITIIPVCTGTPTAGNINVGVPVVPCNTTTTLTAVGTTIGQGISYRWQHNDGGTWNDFGTDAATVTTPPIVHDLQFRCIVSCAGGGVDTTAEVTVGAIPLAANLGSDINVCIDSGSMIVLDAGYLPDNAVYIWEDGSSGQLRNVKEGGTYSVKVTNQFTCVGYDTINVVLRTNPKLELGNDTSVCNGVVLTLDAGNDGINYFWNTGENSRTIDVNSSGSYDVFVTNDQACFKADTIRVVMSGQLPTVSGIYIRNNGLNTFTFTAVNPQNVLGYEWDFGDGSPQEYQTSPTHTYSQPGSYMVVLRLSSDCGFTVDSMAANIVGVEVLNVNKDELIVYPNPARETATILNKGSLKMEQITVYNVLGQAVYQAKADSRDKHVLQLNGFSTGLYTIEIYSDKGIVTRKLELVR